MILEERPLLSLMAYLLSAVCYYYCNSQMFQFFSLLTGKRLPYWKQRGLTYVINYSIFVAVSLLQLYLIQNWTIFALFLVVEVSLIYRCDLRTSIFCGVQGALVGLSINFITRSSAAILTNLPLTFYDSVQKGVENYKIFPISTGFFAAGLFFYLLRRFFHDWQEVESESGKLASLSFSAWLIIVLFLYLDLNLLIYFVPLNENSMILKLWVMKSGICTLGGYTIGIYHIYILTKLRNFELRSQLIRDEFQGYPAKERELLQMASYDSLTGCFIRSRGIQAIEQAYADKQIFCICFLDINNLKQVNDTLGHDMGDRYLTAIVHVLTEAISTQNGDILCRYGGDEFLLFISSSDGSAMQLRMANAARSLEELSNTSEYPFRLWFSCGFASSSEASDAAELIHLADSRMYEHKKRNKNT